MKGNKLASTAWSCGPSTVIQREKEDQPPDVGNLSTVEIQKLLEENTYFFAFAQQSGWIGSWITDSSRVDEGLLE